MSQFLDRLKYFKHIKGEFAGGLGVTTDENRQWEEGYRQRWQHDKIVRFYFPYGAAINASLPLSHSNIQI